MMERQRHSLNILSQLFLNVGLSLKSSCNALYPGQFSMKLLEAKMVFLFQQLTKGLERTVKVRDSKSWLSNYVKKSAIPSFYSSTCQMQTNFKFYSHLEQQLNLHIAVVLKMFQIIGVSFSITWKLTRNENRGPSSRVALLVIQMNI